MNYIVMGTAEPLNELIKSEKKVKRTVLDVWYESVSSIMSIMNFLVTKSWKTLIAALGYIIQIHIVI